uniref:Reverse transcriptase domain-containing protein n=1 Tax=Cannabis sativa TaxID=3483 RepID=A0A803PB73_CANSA
MASTSALLKEVEDQYANILIEGEDDGDVVYGIVDDSDQSGEDRWCIVGKFLTERAIDFDAMRHMMASLFQPGRGMYVKELEPNLYLFQFYDEIDLERVIEGSPWTLNQTRFVFERLQRGQDPRSVVISKLDMWVQVHCLQRGFKTERTLRELGNYIGAFVKTDPKNFQGIWRDYLGVCVTLDINVPLKRRKKLRRTAAEEGFWAIFKYEYGPTFYFTCGILGHSDRFCPQLFVVPADKIVKPYGAGMRAQPRRRNHLIGSKWLITGAEEDDSFTGGATGPDSFSSINVQGQSSSLGGVMTTNQGISIGKLPVIISNQLEVGNSGKSNIQGVNVVVDPIHVGTNMETSEASPLLVIDTKRRRTNEVGFNGPDGVGLKSSDNIEILVCDDDTEEGSKNGLLVGAGDLNNVTSQADKKGGQPYPQWLLDGFCKVLEDCNLKDLELSGYPFTWERGRGSNNWIEVRLDRVLASHDWTQRFISAQFFNLEVTISDHCPILLRTAAINLHHSVAQFRFENAWLREPLCRQKLIVWGQDHTDNFKKRIANCKKEVQRLKWCTDEDSIGQYKRSVAALGEVYTQREVFWCQCSKKFWLCEGDQNSKFFHAKATTRKKNNSINSLLNSSGVWVDWEGGLSDVIADYFTDIFTSTSSNFDNVVNALFQMHPDKSPGPDGVTPGFYQKYWDVVGVDVISQVVDFFETCSFPADLNQTNIVLIPKKKHVTTMSDLRPISLCNVVYKVVSKVLANRLKIVLPCVISENQSAFIPGRLISDNVMIAFEVMHYLKRKRKGKTRFMALKLDLSKAYDRIEWGFLKAMMLRMGFHPRWVDLMMATVMHVEYKVVHGGFSSLIKQFERNGELKGCKVANGTPTISHMLFADDSYIYCRATEEEAQNVLRLLNLFEAAFGQRVNFAKSSIFFNANTPMDSRDRLCNRLGMVVADENSFYLGLPCIMGRKKTAILGFLKEKMEKRILSWEGKFLSKAGREVLLKTVAQALPSYAMSVFLFHLKLVAHLRNLWLSIGGVIRRKLEA